MECVAIATTAFQILHVIQWCWMSSYRANRVGMMTVAQRDRQHNISVMAWEAWFIQLLISCVLTFKYGLTLTANILFRTRVLKKYIVHFKQHDKTITRRTVSSQCCTLLCLFVPVLVSLTCFFVCTCATGWI